MQAPQDMFHGDKQKAADGLQYPRSPRAAQAAGKQGHYTAPTMARPWTLWSLCAALWLAGAASATTPAVLEVSARRVGDLFEVQARATLQAPLPVVWGTLTDYERLPEFVPGLRRSRILSRDGATTTVEQSGEARFLMLTVPIEVVTESTERPNRIEVRRIGGTLRHLQGRYDTEVLATQPPQVLLRWTGSIGLDLELPPLIGETLVRLQLQEQFEGMVREIERREALRRQTQAGRPTQGAPQRTPASRPPVAPPLGPSR